MDSLPNEILCEIFLSSLWEERWSSHPELELEPLYISHVCRRWRNVALSLRELWTYLTMKYQYRKDDNPERMKHIFDTWLERTVNSPLSFTIWFALEHAPDEAHRVFEYIIVTMLKQQRRWKEVDFKWSSLRTSPDFPGINVINMPWLTSLYFAVDVKRHDGATVCSRIDITHSPRLRSLNVHCLISLEFGDAPIFMLTEPSSILFWLDNDDERAPLFMCHRFLEIVPNLTCFHGQFRRDERVRSLELDVMRTLELKNLRKLRLTPGPSAVYTINYLALPSLEALQCGDDLVWSDGEEISEFVHRCTPPLTYLQLQGDCAEDFNLIPALRLLPTLLELRISNASMSEDLFQALSVTDSFIGLYGDESTGNILCPALKVLDLEGMYLSEEDVVRCRDAFIGMLTSRWIILGTFTNVAIDGIELGNGRRGCYDFHMPVTQEHQEIIHREIDKGTWIQITSDGDRRGSTFPEEFPEEFPKHWRRNLAD